ncbi:hypothetical protein MKX03_029625 [Papaver bracteatum]|nr:hypothetical protein MKX03_029625 [Papaver bracteatum]
MMEILSNPGDYSEEDKINTLLSFHKDTCANVLLLLYPSCGDDVLLDPFVDLKILKEFETTVLVDLQIENRQRCLVAIYKHLRQKLESDDDYGAEFYDNDQERLQGVEREQHNILVDLQRLGVDKSKYQDSDGDGDEGPKFMDQYTLLEQEVIRRSNEMVEVLEDVNPIPGYISDLKRHTEIMERGLTARTYIT